MEKIRVYSHSACLSKEKAASIIKKGLSKNKTKIIFPKSLAFLVSISKFMPLSLKSFILNSIDSTTDESCHLV